MCEVTQVIGTESDEKVGRQIVSSDQLGFNWSRSERKGSIDTNISLSTGSLQQTL